MYNKLHIKDHKTGKIDLAFHGNLPQGIMKIRIDDKIEDFGFIRMLEYHLDKKEVKKTIEYLQEFLRLWEEGE